MNHLHLNLILKSSISPYYTNVYGHYNDGKDIFIDGQGGHSMIILRGDILPKPRPEFISLMKYSVEDILLTGDQSITDCFSSCSNKHVWYQIAPLENRFCR